jgi:hypothetical protein
MLIAQWIWARLWIGSLCNLDPSPGEEGATSRSSSIPKKKLPLLLCLEPVRKSVTVKLTPTSISGAPANPQPTASMGCHQEHMEANWILVLKQYWISNEAFHYESPSLTELLASLGPQPLTHLGRSFGATSQPGHLECRGTSAFRKTTLYMAPVVKMYSGYIIVEIQEAVTRGSR